MLQRIIYGAAIVAVIAVVFLILHRPSAEQRVAALLNHQVQLWNDGDVAGLYATLSPTAKVTCPDPAFASLVVRAKEALAGFGSAQASVSDVHVQVTGATAEVSATVRVGPMTVHTFTSADPITYSESNGTWYLESAGALDSACAGA